MLLLAGGDHARRRALPDNSPDAHSGVFNWGFKVLNRLSPASLATTGDGTPFSAAYGDVYHSADGGPGQARHVFLQGNDLPGRWQDRERFVILETGFGTGLNFLATWAAWNADPRHCGRLHYLALEKHPFSAADLDILHARWPEFEILSRELCAAWPLPMPGLHRLEFAGGCVVLTLGLGEAETLLRRCEAHVDAYYLDGFDPKKNPAMWSPELFRGLARLAMPDATLATWCVAGTVRDGLREAGFALEKRPGYGRKRQMLTGRLAPMRRPVTAAAGTGDRHAVVLGAGLAGCALSERLAARGWSVILVDRHAHPAAEASGNLAGIVRPQLARDESLAARLSRAAFLHARRAWDVLERAGYPVRRRLDGVLQIAQEAAQEQSMRAQASAYPEDYVRFLDQAEASRALGSPSALGAWLFPAGGWASPESLCRAWRASAGERIEWRGGQEVAGMERDAAGNWRLLDRDGGCIASAPVLILAAGASLGGLAGALPLSTARGQVSHIPQGALPELRLPACREGYLSPAVDGQHCLGATYAYDDEGGELRVADHAGNLERLGRILPDVRVNLDPAKLDGRVGFRATTPDRLPLIGALMNTEAPLPHDLRLKHMPRRAGLYGLLGLGSRGLVWAALAAEILASRLEGDPAPVETDLLDAIDPARFLLRLGRRPRSAP